MSGGLPRPDHHDNATAAPSSTSSRFGTRPGAVPDAEAVLAKDGDTRSRFDRVGKLVEGFETPYGMELLASVHWVARHGDPAARTVCTRAREGHSDAATIARLTGLYAREEEEHAKRQARADSLTGLGNRRGDRIDHEPSERALA